MPVSAPSPHQNCIFSQKGRLIGDRIRVKTLSRAEKEGKSLKDSDVRTRLAKLNEIANLGQMVYTSEGLQEFLTTPLPIFDGYTALDLMTIGDYDRVIDALAADFEGLGY